jgi:S-adenosyl methyltransferase
VVHVGNDPIVTSHARALPTGDPHGRTAYIEADPRDPTAILDRPDLRGTLDPAQPVGLLLIAELRRGSQYVDRRALR